VVSASDHGSVAGLNLTIQELSYAQNRLAYRLWIRNGQLLKDQTIEGREDGTRQSACRPVAPTNQRLLQSCYVALVQRNSFRPQFRTPSRLQDELVLEQLQLRIRLDEIDDRLGEVSAEIVPGRQLTQSDGPSSGPGHSLVQQHILGAEVMKYQRVVDSSPLRNRAEGQTVQAPVSHDRNRGL
jgi:hypothetical protein